MAVLRILGHALGGLIAGYAAVVVLGVIFLLPADGGGDAGGTAMGIFFGLGPLGGGVGLLAGLAVALARRRNPPTG